MLVCILLTNLCFAFHATRYRRVRVSCWDLSCYNDQHPSRRQIYVEAIPFRQCRMSSRSFYRRDALPLLLLVLSSCALALPYIVGAVDCILRAKPVDVGEFLRYA